MSEQVLENKNQIVAFAPNDSSLQRKAVFVGSLSVHTTDEKLRNFFAKYGEIENVRIIHSETQQTLVRRG